MPEEEDEEQLMMYESGKGESGAAESAKHISKHHHIKDTNLLANHKPNKPAELYSKKFLFSELAGEIDLYNRKLDCSTVPLVPFLQILLE